MVLKEKNECPKVAEKCNSNPNSEEFCIKWWMAAAGAIGASILTLIIVLLSIWIYFKCCKKSSKKKNKSKKTSKRKTTLISDRTPASGILDLSEKNDKRTSPTHRKRRKGSGAPTAIYVTPGVGEPTEPTPNLKKNVQLNPQQSGEKMIEIFEPVDSQEPFNPPPQQHQARKKPSDQSTMELLKSDLFVERNPNLYPKK